MAGTHQKVYQTHSSNTKEKVKYMVWTNEMDHCLAKILAEQVKKGNKVANILKPAAYAAALKALNEKFALDLTKDHIKNRLKTWKKQFGVLKELLAQRGFEWDEAQKMVIADNSVWSDYVQAHPDARMFRVKFIENYDELCIILGNDQAMAGYYDNGTENNLDLTVDKRDLDCAVVSELQIDGNQTEILRWTGEMDHWLGKILVDQMRSGYRIDKMLHAEAYETAVSSLSAKFGPNITKDHIKDRLKTWKKQYEEIKELLSHDGFKWEETQKMIIADDSIWNEYIKINPDAHLLKGRVIKNYNELCTIIGGSYPPDSSMNGAGDDMDDKFMDAQEAYYLGPDSVKEKVKHLPWTDEMDRCLTDLLVEQVMLGNRLEKNFKSSAYMAAVTVLNEKFGLDLTKENIRNRLKTWKKQYNLVKEMLSLGRFEWDERLKMVVGTDSEWHEYVKKHPDARHLRASRIENYNELGMIVGNEQASGRWYATCERLRINPTSIFEEHAETPAGVLANEELNNGNASEEMQCSSEQTRARPSSSHSKQPSKRRISDALLEMMSAMAADIGRIADALTENKKTVCLDEVFELVQKIPGFDDDLIIEACEYLCFDDKRALMFMKLDERLRSKWLLKRLRS